MAPLTSHLTPRTATAEGYDLLESHLPLQQAVERFLAAEQPERAMRARCIGAGRFSYVWLLDGGVVIKISSPTSSMDAHGLGQPLIAEPLTAQFSYLRALREHLERRDPSITTPRQFFVLQSAYGAYLLCQEYMDGWESLGQWVKRVLDPAVVFQDERAILTNPVVRASEDRIRQRLRAAVAGTTLRHGLNDLRLDTGPLHWGNLLVPQTTPADAEPRLCLIDQPGRNHRFRRRLKEIIEQRQALDSNSQDR